MSDMNAGTVTQPGGYPLGASFAPQCRVPNVVGLTQEAAEAQILAYHLVVGTVTEEESEAVGEVLAQSPEDGMVDFGSEVDITVGIAVTPPPGG